jgi:hypothetical protein
MVIDVIYPGWVPFKELAVSEDIPGWIKAHDQILEYPFEQLVTGHLGRVGTRQDVLTQREYVRDLEVAGRNAITSLKFEDVLKRVGADANNSWALFQAYLDMASEMTTKEMLAKWRGKLGAADVFTYDHAQTIVESLRIDYGVLGAFGIRP